MIRKITIIILLAFVFLFSCRTKEEQNRMLTEGLLTPEQIIELDTLRVATLYGSTSCFFLHGEQMGYDYELAQNLADYLGVNLKVHIAKNEDEMFRLLENNKVELIACKTVKTEKLSRKFRFVFPQSESYQVLVQKMGKHTLSNVIQLAGKEIYVKENSVFHRRLNHLNDETGGRIHVKTMPDTISSGNLIGMVVRDSIKYTLAFHDEAMLYKSYYPMLDCNLRIGFPQQKGWLVNKNSELAAVIEDWQSLRQTAQLESKLQTRYWNKNPYLSNIKIKIPRGAISPYDDYFKKYASEISWDWRMLAALAFTESGFDSTEVSVAGAVGLMQLMPATAATLGLDENTYFAPEKNIKAGVDYIKSLNGIFKTVQNKDERKKFVLASYNSGPAHILDAMALAEKYGKNPQLWSGNVEYFLLKKKEPEFYTDTVVKYGTFHGTETVGHVKRVQEIYEKYLKK